MKEVDRTCRKCKESKPLNDFRFCKSQRYGYYRSDCRDCECASWKTPENLKRSAVNAQRWRERNPEKAREVNRRHRQTDKFRDRWKAYRERNRDKLNAQHRSRYAANPSRLRNHAKTYAKKYPERVKARYQRWREANKEHVQKYQEEHNKKRAEQMRQYARLRRKNMSVEDKLRQAEDCARRRARMHNTPKLERISRKAIIERDHSTCYLCDRVLSAKEITLDHVIPLTKGGPHTFDNLKVACRPCNSRKRCKIL